MNKQPTNERGALRWLLQLTYRSQKECAEDLGICANSISRYVRGERLLSLESAVKISARAGISLDAFVQRVYPELVTEAHDDAR